MSYPILKALYNGTVIPGERRNINTPERTELLHKFRDEDRYFKEKMSPEDFQRFQALEDLLTRVVVDDETETYAQGFTLGALLMLEVMAKKETMISL